MYPSYIQVNICGYPFAEILRNAIKFFDDNAFVTMWISSILLEITRFDSKNNLPDEQLLSSIEAISSYHDKNYPINDSILVFWTETYNSSTSMWTCGPVNLNGIAKEGEGLANYIKHILDDLGMSILWKYIEPMVDFM